jgi:hypothetical protein
MRVLIVTSPSGGEARFHKFGVDYDRELSWWHGRLAGHDEELVLWRAKLAAERAGVHNWEKAVAIFTAAGWTVREEQVTT